MLLLCLGGEDDFTGAGLSRPDFPPCAIASTVVLVVRNSSRAHTTAQMSAQSTETARAEPAMSAAPTVGEAASASRPSAPVRSAPTVAAPSSESVPLFSGVCRSRLPRLIDRLERFTLYETKSRLYLVGSPAVQVGACFRIMKIERLQANFTAYVGSAQ
jgi:hypothetical protein